MRVLHVIARLNVGGTARYLTQLVNELPKHGIQTFIATGFVQGSEAEDHSSQSIQILRIPALGRAINPFKDYKAYKQLEEIIAEVKPDVIHTHTFKAGYITRIKKRSVPLVHTFHGHLLADPEFSGLKLRIIILIEKIINVDDNASIDFNDYIEYIEDRPFNDKRYYISNDKLKKLGWNITVDFETGINELVK